MDSLIPAESMQLVGERLSEPIAATIHTEDAQRFALATDDRNPIYFDEAAARKAGYRTLPVPPTLLAWALAPPRPLDDLRVDGLFHAAGRRIPLNVDRVMAAGEEWEFLAPIYVEDRITAETRLHSLEEKVGRSGPFVVQIAETRFTNQDGELVALQRAGGIAR